MEKITGVPENPEIQNKQNPRKTTSDKSDLNISFRDTLQNAMEQPNKIDSTQSTPPLGEIDMTSFNKISVSPTVVSEKTDILLSLIETYTAELSDPSKTLKELEPLIRKVRDSANELSEQAELLNPENSDLKRIAQQSAVTANVEYIKFNRGDYL